MPRSAGTYTLPLPPLQSGAVISAADDNTTFNDIATALTGSVPRDGTGAMQAALPMGGYKVTGMANATASTDAAAYGQLAEVLLTKTILTGLTSQVDFALPTGFTSYRMVGVTLYSASANLQLGFRISTNSGASYDAGASDYGSAYSFQSNALNAGAVQGSSILVTEQTTANIPQFFTAFISPGDAAFGLRAWGTSTGANSGGTFFSSGTFSGARSATGRATNIRLLPSVQLGVGGVITLFGVV